MESDQRDPYGVGMSAPEGKNRELGVDVALRRILEPHPLAVERLVRTALRQGEKPSASPRVRWWPRLAVAAAVVLLLVFLVPRPFVEPPPAVDGPPSEASSAPARISISNDDGWVTISSTAGSKWILYSGDDAP